MLGPMAWTGTFQRRVVTEASASSVGGDTMRLQAFKVSMISMLDPIVAVLAV